MTDYPDNKNRDETDPDKTIVMETGRDEVVDAEYLDEPEEGQGELTEDPENWPELGEDEEPEEAAKESAGGTDKAAEQLDEEAEREEPVTTVAKPKNMRWDTMFLLLLTCVTLIRLGYLYIVPLDLGPDESYYWDWSRKLDLGYYSKPPMIAWINALSTGLLGVSAQAVRMPAVVFGAIGLIGMYLCGRRMFNGEVAFWGVAAWLATPGTAALGLIMATDVLLVCCWCLALYTLWRAIETDKSNAFWWLLTMLLIGLGSLSKQMMMIFPLLMFAYLLFSADRKRLLSRWPWLTWFGSLLFLLPPLWWNFQHDWITFKHTSHHIEPVGTSMLDHVKTFAEFVGGQMGLLTPITWLLLLLLAVSLLLKMFRWSRQTKFLFIFGATGLFAFSLMSFKQSINPNWPATFYPAGLLLLAAWGKEQLSAGFSDRLRRWFVPGVKLGIALTFVAYLLPFAMQLSFIPLGKKDPTYRIKGWQELGQQVGETMQQQPRPEETFVISPLRKYPAEIAFYAPGNPTTYKWPGNPPRVSSQYELWPGPVDKLGWDALIIHNADSPLPAELAAIFENVVELGEQSIPIGAAGERKYHLWRGENLLSWPEWQ
jgi:4-amino-4-deoxy-L-arabinose transferase-like glycosyltransferase